MCKQEHLSSKKIKIPQHFTGSVAQKNVSEILQQIQNSETEVFVLDFVNCDLVDSSGIGSLISLAKDCRSDGIRLILKNINNDLYQLFKDTGLNKIFTIEKAGAVKEAQIDLFDMSADIKLIIKKEFIDDICVFVMSGVMNYPLGSGYFKQQFLLSLTNNRKIILDMEKLDFFDSLSISSVLNMNNLLRNTGGSLRICGANYIIKDMFLTLGINEIIPVFDNCQEALKNWNFQNV